MNKVQSLQLSIIALIFILLICLSDSQPLANKSTIVEFNNYYVDKPYIQSVFTSILSGDRHIYSYTFNTSLLEQWPAWQLQFYAETEPPEYQTSETNYPMVATTYWHGSIRSWEVPVHVLNDTKDLTRVNRYSDDIVGKVLWYSPESKLNEFWNLTVEISVHNDVMIYYKMKIVVLMDFLVRENTMVSAIATPSSPSIFMFVPPLDWQYVFIEVASDSDICALFGVHDFQEINGPFLDQLSMRFTETFTRKTGLTLWGDQFPLGFVLIFYPFINDKECQLNASSSSFNPFRKKDLIFVVREGMSSSAYYLPLLVPLVLILGFGGISFLFQRMFNRFRCELMSRDGGFSPNLIQRKHTLFKSNIKIIDLIIEEPNRVVAQSQRYCRWVCISTAFYSLPVFQLIKTFSKRLLDTGNFDICYFNHYCLHMLGSYHDFNHIYSNIGYILFGLMYCALVRHRQTSQNSFKTTMNLDNGAITHYSLLYCLAFTLTMTGIMSAAYHVCPNQNNFQFDTIFMYTVAAFTVVTLYQLRHPTYLSALVTSSKADYLPLYCSESSPETKMNAWLVACITVLGLLWEQFIVRVGFTVIHSIFLISVLPKVCFNGYIRRNGRLVHHWCDMMPIIFKKLKDDLKHGKLFQVQRDDWIAPHDPEIMIIHGPGRIILPGFLLIINALSLLAIWTAFASQNFATQVLFMCVMNGSLYIIFYCALKWYHGECRRRIWIQPGLYLFFSLTLWGIAIYFFFQEETSWETTPSESRLQNKDCILLGFYDSHDMWHFLSSAGLFCSAMLLLTIDDDIVDQPKSTIPVF